MKTRFMARQNTDIINIFTKTKRKNAQQCDISKIVLVILNPDHFWSTQFGGWKKTVSLEWVGHYAKVAVTTCSRNLLQAESPLLIPSHQTRGETCPPPPLTLSQPQASSEFMRSFYATGQIKAHTGRQRVRDKTLESLTQILPRLQKFCIGPICLHTV